MPTKYRQAPHDPLLRQVAAWIAYPRLYTLFGDQLRTLIPTLEGSGLEIVSSTKAELLANPLNQTGIVVTRLPRATATRPGRRRRPSPESAG